MTPHRRRYGNVTAEFVVGLGIAAEHAASLVVARGIDLGGEATPIGLGCRACFRHGCPQRSVPPVGRALLVDDRARGLAPFEFAGD